MKPTFIIVGAARSGTTSLYHYLGQHPNVGMSFIKETHFFDYLAAQSLGLQVRRTMLRPPRTLAEYELLFPQQAGLVALGEATPMYMFVPGVPAQIKAYLPDARLIFVLRNPIHRAYSAYLKNVRDGIEGRTFENAVEDELSNQSAVFESRNYYVRMGHYHSHLLSFFQYFEPAQVSIYFYDDLVNSPKTFMCNLFSSIGVDPGFVPDTSVKFNHAGIPAMKASFPVYRWKPLILRLRGRFPSSFNMALYQLQAKLQTKFLKSPSMSARMREFLRNHYDGEILNLQELTKRDLSSWLRI